MTTAWGLGLATTTLPADGRPAVTLDTWYPRPVLGAPDEDLAASLKAELAPLEGVDAARRVRRSIVERTITLDEPPVDAEDVYLRLHLLSHRLVAPHGQDLTGVFGLLANVVWTDRGPCAVEDFELVRAALTLQGGRVTVYGIDKFPRMVDYVVPTGVRIGDGDRVRLGAHLAAGTTVMHEGFVNFNAGTLGTCMIEGRVSGGVVVGDGSDVGGGASIMGTLSGGGTQVISIGRRCLVGANAGLGISLGDDCVIEAGLYLTAGTKVRLMPEDRIVKAVELSQSSGLQFWRNAQSGAVEARPRAGRTVALNPALHAVD